jgi:arginase
MKKIKLIEVKSEIGAGTRGASMGVDAIKTASLDKKSDYFTLYPMAEAETYNEVLFEEPAFPYAKYIESVYDTCVNVATEVAYALRNRYFPIVLAGDHSSSAGTIAGIKRVKRKKRLGIIWVDAHADIQTPFTTGSGNMHGMPLAVSVAEDNQPLAVNVLDPTANKYWEKLKNMSFRGAKINPSDIVYIAVRDIDPPEKALIRKYKIRNFTVPEVNAKGIEAIAEEALDHLWDCDNIYISFDVDSMDTNISKGTGTPVEDGLKIPQVKQLLSLLVSDRRVCCFEMVEVNPTLDSENVMAEVAFDILEQTTEALKNR